jgi:hypothetical protein
MLRLAPERPAQDKLQNQNCDYALGICKKAGRGHALVDHNLVDQAMCADGEPALVERSSLETVPKNALRSGTAWLKLDL